MPDIIRHEKQVDVIFVDPPRCGLDSKTIDTLLKVKAKKIIYISCNPESLAFNLKDLSSQYKICEIQPFDMFAMTEHVETVCLLTLKNQ